MARRVAVPLFWAGVFLSIGAPRAGAQTCWRGQPAPRCRAFWITESGPRFGAREAFGAGIGSATALGFMVNRGSSAWGGTVELSTGSEGGTYRVALLPRYRRWIGSHAIDVGVGVALLGEGDRPFGWKGVSATLAWSVEDWVALVGEVEQRRAAVTTTSATVGVRFGSYLGPVAAGLSAVLGVLASLGAGG